CGSRVGVAAEPPAYSIRRCIGGGGEALFAAMGFSGAILGPFVQYRQIWRKGPLQPCFINCVRSPERPAGPFGRLGKREAKMAVCGLLSGKQSFWGLRRPGRHRISARSAICRWRRALTARGGQDARSAE